MNVLLFHSLSACNLKVRSVLSCFSNCQFCKPSSNLKKSSELVDFHPINHSQQQRLSRCVLSHTLANPLLLNCSYICEDHPSPVHFLRYNTLKFAKQLFLWCTKRNRNHSDWVLWPWRTIGDNMHEKAIFVTQISKYVPEFLQDVPYSCAEGHRQDHMSFKSHLNTIVKALVGLLRSITLFMGTNLLSVIFIPFSKENCILPWGSGTILWVKMKVFFFSKFSCFLLFSHFSPALFFVHIILQSSLSNLKCNHCFRRL